MENLEATGPSQESELSPKDRQVDLKKQGFLYEEQQFRGRQGGVCVKVQAAVKLELSGDVAAPVPTDLYPVKASPTPPPAPDCRPKFKTLLLETCQHKTAYTQGASSSMWPSTFPSSSTVTQAQFPSISWVCLTCPEISKLWLCL